MIKNTVYIFLFATVLMFFSQAKTAEAGNGIKLEMPSGKISIVTAQIINGHKYLHAAVIAKIVFDDATYSASKSTISNEYHTLKFDSPSVFISLKKGSTAKIVKTRMPVLIIKKQHYFPLISFTEAMETLELFRADIRTDFISLSSYGSKMKKGRDNDAEKTAEAYKEDSQKRIDIHKNRPVRGRLFEKKSAAPKSNIPANSKRSFQPQPKSYPPNRYVIPSKLIRKEIKQTEQEIKQDTSSDSEPLSSDSREIDENTYASSSAGVWAVSASLRFVKIKAVGKRKATEIYLSSNKIIKDYQKAEIRNNEIILRVPNASNSIKKFDRLCGLGIIEEIQVEKVRKYLIYRIKLRATAERCTIERNGPKELVCRIFHQPLPKSTARKVPPKDIIPDNATEAKSDKGLMKAITKVIRNSELDCIVLDPGHGGKDPGAVGCNGTKEKDITLILAKKLRALLKKSMPDTKIVMTREDDRFIELYRRGKIANEAGGKLFISIHLNAARKKPHKANGFETFILRPGKNDDAVRVAELENASIKFEKSRANYKKLTEEEIIVATMAQSAFVKFSEKFAAQLQDEIDISTNLTNRGVKQAGFYVLIGASMPNVLFEAAFLSNKKEEKFAKSETGQNKIAIGMARAVLNYAEEYSITVKK
ncbi:MAG: N-acetylmuramoyl-L-alanine amidase [Candidatus Kapabacteria bacterium]|jgi:N-acetylmuramoyl-L-alanine amidase|nr:N-acetylmuramoyl-L-alanine amidase [Candidatus Kapabacteria bacterium]